MAFLVTFGGVVGSVGFASAAASNLTISPTDTVTSDTLITLSADPASVGNDKDLTFAIDKDGNGTIESGEHLKTVNSSNRSEISFTPSNKGIGEGTYTIYVVEETNGDDTDDKSTQINSSDSSTYDDSTTFTVDDTAPTLDSATKVDVTTINVTLSDSVGLDASSINEVDFGVDAGTISSVDSSSISSGNVTITLKNAVDNESVNVSIASEQSISDTAGNILSSGTVEATGMDGVAPAVTKVIVTQDGGDDTVTMGDTVSVTADVFENATGSGVDTVTVDASPSADRAT